MGGGGRFVASVFGAALALGCADSTEPLGSIGPDGGPRHDTRQDGGPEDAGADGGAEDLGPPDLGGASTCGPARAGHFDSRFRSAPESALPLEGVFTEVLARPGGFWAQVAHEDRTWVVALDADGRLDPSVEGPVRALTPGAVLFDAREPSVAVVSVADERVRLQLGPPLGPLADAGLWDAPRPGCRVVDLRPSSADFDSDGRRVIAFRLTCPGVLDRMGVIQLLPDRIRDPAFGDRGLVWLDDGAPTAVALVGGRIYVGRMSLSAPGVVALDRTGQLVEGFAEAGLLFLATPPAALAHDGAGLVVGQTRRGMFDSDIVLTRWRPDGTPDLGFGDGMPLVIAGVWGTGRPGDDRLSRIRVEPDGALLALGLLDRRFGQEMLVARVVEGRLDPAFGDEGLAAWGDGVSTTGVIAAARDPCGRLVVAGASSEDGRWRPALRRLYRPR